MDVFDPIWVRDGRAFLDVDSLQVSRVLPIPTLSRWGVIALAASLMAVAAFRGLRPPGQSPNQSPNQSPR